MYVLLQEMWSKPHVHWFYPLLIFAISFANGTSSWQPIRQDDLGDGRVQLISWEVNVPKVTLFIKKKLDFLGWKSTFNRKKMILILIEKSLNHVEINELLHLAPIMAHLLDFLASRVPPLWSCGGCIPPPPPFCPKLMQLFRSQKRLGLWGWVVP